MRRSAGGPRTGMVWRAASLALCVFFLVQFASLIVLHNATAADVGHQNVGHQAGGRISPVNSLSSETGSVENAATAGMVPKGGGTQARAEAATAQAAHILKGQYLNAGKRDSGMGQTQQWLNVVSGSPHWLSQKDRAVSDALLESIEREATSKFGRPAPSPPPPLCRPKQHRKPAKQRQTLAARIPGNHSRAMPSPGCTLFITLGTETRRWMGNGCIGITKS